MDLVDFFLIWVVPFSIVLILLFYLLWINGYLINSRKTAILFVGSFRRKNRCKIKFKSCNGYIKKVLKLRESRNYKFTLNSNITKGDVTAEIQDVNKKILLQLDKNNPETAINLEKNHRYYLVLRFVKADGELDLTWN